MWITNEFKDRHVAPNMSRFTAATIPDMSAVSAGQDHWLGNFMLSTGTLRFVLDDAARRTWFSFLRRTMMAFREYAAARDSTVAYLTDPNPNAVSGYFIAIGHWEIFLGQAYHAWLLLGRKPLADGHKFYAKGDGSQIERLNRLYNRSKHTETAINAGQFPPDGTLPVWLENDGLYCTDGALTFGEMAEVLRELAVWADAMQEPSTMRAKVQAHYGTSVAG
ncbi:MAG: hypothetical protein M3Y33_11580 [Actinomycetota bacterium]|nr:hypothetical protein [Actinomycetota bacterium]